jgi:Fe-S oxidoreductase/nitrate reductase gamma subunit
MNRIPYWNIQYGFLIDLLVIPVMIIFAYGIYDHWKKLRAGVFRLRFSWIQIKEFLGKQHLTSFILGGLIGIRVYRHPLTGIFHGMVYWGMLVLFCGTIMVMLNVFLSIPTMSGSFYQWFMALSLDVAGLVCLAGIVFLLVRRACGYHRLVKPKPRSGFMLIEISLILIILSGFFLEGFRISHQGIKESAIIGQWVAGWLTPLNEVLILHTVIWWAHGLLSLALMAFIPFSPLSHLFFIPVNSALIESPIGVDTEMPDFEISASSANDELPTFGTPTIQDFNQKRLLDLNSCLWCGRCQEVCPATLTDKELNPKGVMTTLAEKFRLNQAESDNLIDAIQMENIFNCRTCAACVDICPAFANPLKAIMGMRQNLVMERGEMPLGMQQTYRNMEASHHPFSLSVADSDWKKDMDVKPFKTGQTEYLLWVGCAIKYEERAQMIGRAMIHILNRAGVSYGIIENTRCSGDPAKQMGDDYLFSMLAKGNIDIFQQFGVRKIITICPHCYNSFAHYYPALGGVYEVIPHVNLINELIRTGKISISKKTQSITFHDPCYLGRHNAIFTAPRNVIAGIGNRLELPRHRRDSFCCGAGGGNYWNEEKGTSISYTRAKEIFTIGADQVASACPFCLIMLTESLKMFTDQQLVSDIAELVVKNMNSDNIKKRGKEK